MSVRSLIQTRSDIWSLYRSDAIQSLLANLSPLLLTPRKEQADGQTWSNTPNHTSLETQHSFDVGNCIKPILGA